MRGSACAVEVEGEARHPVATPADEVESLDWFAAQGATGQGLPVRGPVRARCRCRVVEYEYGVIGGAYRIRRTDWRRGVLTRVTETPAVPHRVADEWWQALMQGRAV